MCVCVLQYLGEDGVDPASRSVEVARDLEAVLNALKRKKNAVPDDSLEQLERFDSGAGTIPLDLSSYLWAVLIS